MLSQEVILEVMGGVSKLKDPRLNDAGCFRCKATYHTWSASAPQQAWLAVDRLQDLYAKRMVVPGWTEKVGTTVIGNVEDIQEGVSVKLGCRCVDRNRCSFATH